MSDLPNDRTKPLQEASVSGPGSIAARETDGKPRPADAAAPLAQTSGRTPAVGTPGASDQTNQAPDIGGLSGQLTNEQVPMGGNVTGEDRTPPDMEETPDPRGDARDPPPR